MRKKQRTEFIAKYAFMICSTASIAAVLLISFYIFYRGVPAIFKIGLFKLILGTVWNPSAGLYGILPMIVGSLLVTVGAIIIGVPIGLFLAVFLAEYCPKKIYAPIKSAVELLAGIPSVVYGFFGLVVIVPIIGRVFDGAGYSLLAASIILGIMILPTIANISEASLRAVPRMYYEGGLSLGANHTESVFFIVLPAAKSGVITSIILGIGRAIGETMAVILVAGNTPMFPHLISDPIRTMTANIAIEMSYATGLHQDALFATGVVLFLFIIILNIVLNIVTRRSVAK